MCEDVFYVEEHDFNQEIQLKKKLGVEVEESRIIE